MSDETKKNWGRSLENTFQFFNRLIVEKGVFFRLHTRLCLFHHRAHVYHFSSFISLLDAFDITDPNGVQDAFHTIYETCTELVHSSESLWQKVRTQNPKVYELIPRKESKFSLSLYLFSFPIADSFFNVLLNRSSWLLENTCVTPTVRGTKIYTNILQSVRNVVGNLNAYLRNALHQKKNPKMNTQSASINAKIFGTLLILSTFHIVEFLSTCNETFTRSFSI